MARNEADVEAVLRDAREALGDDSSWIEPSGYRDGLALCIIDAIQSTGSHYSSVVNVVRRYVEARRAEGDDPYRDGAAALVQSFDVHGGPEGWATAIGNAKPTHTRPGAPLKAAAIQDAAARLAGMGIDSTTDLLARDEAGTLCDVKNEWLDVASQSSGVTWNYLLVLAGIPNTKPDRMIMRFVARSLSREISVPETAEIIRALADRYPTDVTRLDHALWRYESGRDVRAPESP